MIIDKDYDVILKQIKISMSGKEANLLKDMLETWITKKSYVMTDEEAKRRKEFAEKIKQELEDEPFLEY